jgi:hypothetical protein
MFVIECALIFLNQSARKLFLDIRQRATLRAVFAGYLILGEPFLTLLVEISASVLLEGVQLPTDSNHLHF